MLVIRRFMFRFPTIRATRSLHSDPFNQFFNQVFPPHEYALFLNSPPSMDEDPSYIIDSPSLKLSVDYPLITTSLHLNEVRVQQALIARPGQRTKPIIVCTKGKGGGKTRIMEEIRLATNRKHDSLAIGLTFNNHTLFDAPLDVYMKNDPALSFALAIVTRTISSIYKTYHEQVVKRMRNNEINLYNLITEQERNGLDFPEMLLRSFFKWILITHPQAQQRKVKHFVVLVDEYRKYVDGFLDDLTPEAKEKYKNANFSAPLHRALLNQELLPGVKICLILSTLIFSNSIVTTDSGRPIGHLLLAEELDSQEVLNSWIFNPQHTWLEKWFVSHELTENSMIKFKLIVELLNKLPRCLEYMEIGISNDRENFNFPVTGPIRVDSSYYQKLILYILESFRLQYKNSFPSPGVMMAVLQSEIIDYPKNIDHIKDSTFSNTYDPMKDFIPVASVISLYNGATRASGDPVASALVKIIENIITRITTFKKSGDLLEYLGAQWCLFKFLVLRKSLRQLTLQDFFTLSGDSEIEPAVLSKLNNIVVHVPEECPPIGITKHPELKYSTWRNPNQNFPLQGTDDFTEVLNKITDVSFESPVQIHQFHDGECFDLLLVFFDQRKNKPFLVFIDWKSKYGTPNTPSITTEDDGNSSSCSSRPTQQGKPPGHQFVHLTENVIPYINDQVMQNLVQMQSSALQALSDGDYCCIYLTTGQEGQKSFSRGKAVVMARRDSEKFFSFLFPLYKSLRGLS
jgi:hypothetical protein